MGQKLQKGTREEIAQILEKGRWPHFTPPLLKVFLWMSPAFYVGYWEYCRRKKTVLELAKAKEDFKGDTPFYGKAWGYTTDYLIETSLKDGDLIFFSYDRDSLHFHEHVLKWISNKVAHTTYDDVGIIVHINGVCHVAYLKCGGGVSIEKYSERLASSFPLMVTVRRLQCSEEVRKKVMAAVQEEAQKFLEVKGSRVEQIWADFWRLRATRAAAFSRVKEYLKNEWEIQAHKVIISRLNDLLQDIQHTTKAPGNKNKNLFPKSPPSSNYSEMQEENIKLLIASKEKETEELLALQEKAKTDFKSSSSAKGTLLKNLGINLEAQSNFVCAVYQRVGLLPPFPPYYFWTLSDMLALEYLCCAGAPSPIDCRAQNIAPRLSQVFHIRQDDVEKQQLEKVFFKKLPEKYK